MKIIERFKKLKKFADKHQFTLQFNVLDMPAEIEEKRIATFYFGTGLRRFISLLLGKQSNYIAFFLQNEKKKRGEFAFSVNIRGNIKGRVFIERFQNLSPGLLYVVTVVTGESLFIRINNSVTNKDVCLIDFPNGYRMYEVKDIKSDDGWFVKLK